VTAATAVNARNIGRAWPRRDGIDGDQSFM
jgi:hypothetical protein